MLTQAEALDHVLAGGRATCDALPQGTVLKLARASDLREPSLRVVFEATGDSFDFTDRLREESQDMPWRKVEGWANV